jgi:hypothetical protein
MDNNSEVFDKKYKNEKRIKVFWNRKAAVLSLCFCYYFKITNKELREIFIKDISFSLLIKIFPRLKNESFN